MRQRAASRRRALALAASASLRALPLRRVLLGIVAGFVLLPLLVFHAATRDVSALTGGYSRAFLRSSTSPSSSSSDASPRVPRCLNASLLAPAGLERARRECTTRSGNNSSAKEEPLVHFVHVALDQVPRPSADEAAPPAPLPQERVTFLQFAAVQSVRALVRPSMMVLHYVEKVPRGVWYTQVQRHLSLHKVLAPEVHAAKSLDMRRRRQLMEFLLMLRALHKQGGVAFSDFNTIMLRDTLLRTARLEALVASQVRGELGLGSGFHVGVHTLQAPAKHPLLKYLEHELLELAARDDPKLLTLPLEKLVGQLILDKYKLEHGEEAGKSSLEAAVTHDVIVGASELFEGIPQTQILSLLKANVGDAHATSIFRGVTAFHFDKYDFHSNRNDTEALRAIRGLEDLTAEGVLEGDSLIKALLRFTTGLNTTAELDVHLAS